MPVDVLTRSYTNQRTGVNLQETTLTKATVNVNHFGKLFTRSVDGQIYAQPLIATDITIKNKTVAEVVFVATTRNFVYAFNAKDPDQCDFLWRSAQLGSPVPRTDFNLVPRFPTIPNCPDFPGKSKNYLDFTEEIGIVSTPVIDDTKQFLYVVAKSKANGQYFNKLHKLSLATGQDVEGSPVTIGGNVLGKGFHPADSAAGTVPFNPQWHLNRPGLLLALGKIYIAFGSQGDEGPYHGWVFSYDAQTLKPKAVHCTTPDWGEGGIWQSGSGLAFDGSHVYYVAGNGPDAGSDDDVKSARNHVNRQPSDAELKSGPFFGNTIVKLNPESLDVVDWFSPADTRELSQGDQDFCSGPVLPEGTTLVLGFDKEGFIHVCDRNNMGHFNRPNNQNIQSQKITQWNIHGTPLYWQPKRLLFLWSEQDACLGYRLGADNRFTFVAGAFSRFRFAAGVNQMPGAMLALSANGDQNGIVWAAHPTDKNANQATVAGTLRALDADNLQNELWNSDHDPQGSDAVGNFAKFCPPVVANGKVYVATFSRGLVVYGQLGAGEPKPLGPWQQASIGTGVLGSASETCDRFTILGAGRDIWDTADAFHFVYQQVGGGRTSLTALVSGIQDTNPWAKAGVMLRESLDPQSPHAMVVMTPENGVAFQHRDSHAAASINFNIAGVKLPHWVRIVRDPVPGQAGRFRFTGFHSADGSNWFQVDQPVEFGMAGQHLAGLAVTSHTVTTNDPNSIIGLEELNESTFESVELQST
jgi:hypothetical protein